MSCLKWSFLMVLLAVGVYMSVFWDPPERPEIVEGWWGRGERRPDDPKIKEFKVHVSDAVLADLKLRLVNTRLGEDLENNENFHYGFNVATMRQVIAHWKDKYDWRTHEKTLNSYPQYKTQIEGIDVHFLRIKPNVSGNVKPKPLLMLHGWPGSVWEFYKIIPLLTDPVKYGGQESEALEVICPSIPGFGFSEAPHQLGFGPVNAATMFVKLMEKLGHRHFYLQGGDWGAIISQFISQMYPSKPLGVHLTTYPPPIALMTFVRESIASIVPSLYYKDNEYDKFVPSWPVFVAFLRESGYLHLQGSKPDTIGMALNESPVGLAAYVLEKFSTWTRDEHRELADGGLTRHYTMDELLTIVMIYWVTGTITSSSRIYREDFINEDAPIWDQFPVEVPAGLVFLPDDHVLTPEFQARTKYRNIVQLTDLPQGGHFSALEQPETLARDIQSFIRKVEQAAHKTS